MYEVLTSSGVWGKFSRADLLQTFNDGLQNTAQSPGLRSKLNHGRIQERVGGAISMGVTDHFSFHCLSFLSLKQCSFALGNLTVFVPCCIQRSFMFVIQHEDVFV